MITFIGTGLLGANFTRALLLRGEKVNVWNRSAEKAKALEEYGAMAFKKVEDAVRGSMRIHITLSDDASVDGVLAAASPGLEKGAIIIDHTTTSAPGAARRSSYWKQQGVQYVHAPVFMGPPSALEGTGTMLVSGDQEVIRQISPELSKMTGRLWNLGEQPDKAASMKLLGNLMHIGITGAVSDLLSLSDSLQVDAAELVPLLDMLNPGVVAQGRLRKITSHTFEQASWELSMARKDARLMMEQAASTRSNLMVVPAVANRMDAWIAKGHGKDDWTILSQEI